MTTTDAAPTLALSRSHRRQHEIAERDGWTCAYCGRRVACRCGDGPVEDWELPATVDHRIAQVRGGGHQLDNLVLACQPCNSRKHARELEAAPVRHAPSDIEVRHRAFEYLDRAVAEAPCVGDQDDRSYGLFVSRVCEVLEVISGDWYPPGLYDHEQDESR